MNIKDYAIGETFHCGEVLLRVDKATNKKDLCEGCWFDTYCQSAPACSDGRADKTDVVFVEVEEEPLSKKK